MENNMKVIGESLNSFQAALNQNNSSLGEFIKENYTDKWLSDSIYHAMQIRTAFVQAANNFLADEGLLNIEKVMLGIITDPLAHDIEHTPSIKYKGHNYVTTHSMIYNKFLACANKNLKGIYTDSSNIRLELESPTNTQRGRYIIDFSQIDIELRRNRDVSLNDYFSNVKKVTEVLNEDMSIVKNFFERLIISITEEINKKQSDALSKLGIALEVPKSPFPSFYKDEASRKYGQKNFEKNLGEETKSQFFWITGLARENYDLIYPYLSNDNKKTSPYNASSKNIFNYDILAKSIDKKSGKQSDALEILSGGIREWLYEPIIERLLDNKVLPVQPVFKNGNIENINDLGGYGPFLYFASMKDGKGKNIFPDTMGGGIGIERTLYSILKGEKITKIDDLTFFGKNPDSHPIYLF